MTNEELRLRTRAFAIRVVKLVDTPPGQPGRKSVRKSIVAIRNVSGGQLPRLLQGAE